MFALKPECIVLIRRVFEAALRAWLILRQERAFIQLVKWHALCHCIYGFMALFSFPESGIVLLECTTENPAIKIKLEAAVPRGLSVALSVTSTPLQATT